MFKKLSSWIGKLWRDPVLAGVFAAAISGSIGATWAWWDAVNKWFAAAYTWINQPIPIPLWLLSFILLIFFAVLVVFCMAIFYGRSSSGITGPSYRDYKEDRFYGLTWRWGYGESGDIHRLAPLCIRCLCEVESLNNWGSVTFQCIKCRHQSETVEGNPYSVESRVEALIRQKLRTGGWKEMTGQQQRSPE